MPILNLEKCISYIARFILIFRRSILVLSYIIIHTHDKWSLPSKMGESYKDPPIVRVVRLERTTSSTQRLSLCSFGSFVPRIALSAPFTLLFCALISTDSRCSEAVCGLIWGQKRFLTRGGRCLPVPARKHFFVREVTRFPAAAGRHPWPLAYPGSGVHHTTSCGTSSRNSGSSPWTAVRRRRVPTQGHSLLLQAGGGSFPCDESHACAVCDSNCGLCSIVLTP